MPTTAEVRFVPLGELVLSDTPAQAERRKHFDKAALGELAESIKSTSGVLQPIVARPVKGNGKLEVVCGERRVEATRIAGLDSILASVRELSDEEVLEIQLIENLQREGLHELAEAEGYEQLMKAHGYKVEDLAEKIGKSKAYVYARLKLTALCKEARSAFYAGKITAASALLLARIPVDSLQKQALKEITPSYLEGPMSSRQVAHHIQERYMLRLDQAPFDTKAKDLVKGALPCAQCPKNTLTLPILFSDVKQGRAGVCTDPGCFKAKREASQARQVEAAKAEGREVIDGKRAKEIFPWGTQAGAKHGFRKLDDEVYTGKRYQKIRQLLGKDVKPILVQHPESEKLVEVVPESVVRAALKAKGLSTGRATMGGDDGTAQVEARFRRTLYERIRAKTPEQLARADLEMIAFVFFDRILHDAQKKVIDLWGWEPVKRKSYGVEHADLEATAAREVPKLSDADLVRLLFDCCYTEDLHVATWSDEKPTRLLAAAKRFRVDPEKVRAELKAEAKAKKTRKKKGE